jgi:DNA polymerase-3 subunit gamma/tau
MSTLYRKYRPQKFSDLIGQEHLVQTLVNEISDEKIAHAYLFSGPRGTGKTTMARLLAKAINCQNRTKGEFEPCNECSSCTEITASRNIDVIEIDAASNTGVDNVRENIIDNAQFKPTKSKYKVFIIDEVHMLSTSAFNALLKTLEEPPSHVVFILATTELRKLPMTIISRCQRFNFKKIPEDIMIKKLEAIVDNEGVKVEKDVLKKIIIKSDGCMRDAESLLGQILSLNLKKITALDAELILPSSDIEEVLKFLFSIADGATDEALSIIDNLIKNGTNLEQFALEIIEVLRASMISLSGNASYGPEYAEKDRKLIKELAVKLGNVKLINIIGSAITRKSEMKLAPVPQLPLELLAVEFSHQIKECSNQINTHDDSAEEPPKNTEKKQEKKIEEKKIASKSDLKIETAKEKWPEVIARLADFFPSLVFVLKMAEVKEINNDEITISLPYSFHKEKIEDLKCKIKIEEVFGELLEKKVSLKCVVNEEAESNKQDNSELSMLAAQFGGEVVA